MVIDDDRDGAPDPSFTPASVTIIPVDERLSASADLAEVVESASGTVVRRLGGLGDYSAVSIRGSSFRQVQIYLDGIPLNPDGGQSVNLSEFPLHALERVELYRGNAPPEFAAAPIGGVVNLVSGRRSDPTMASAEIGAFGTGRGALYLQRTRNIRGVEIDGVALVNAFRTNGDFEYFTDKETIYNLTDDEWLTRHNNDKFQTNALFRTRVSTNRWEFTLSDGAIIREEGLPGPTHAPTCEVRLGTRQNLLSANLATNSRHLDVDVRSWWLERREVLDDRNGEIGVGNQWQRSDTRTVGLLTHAVWNPRTRWMPASTLSVRRDQYDETDLVSGNPEEPRLRTAVLGSLSADGWFFSDQLRISPVVQGTWLDNRALGTVPYGSTQVAAGDQEITTSLDPRIGILVRPRAWPRIAFKSNLGRYLRPPDFSELFGDRGAIVGNSSLVPEEGVQIDLGSRLNWMEHTRVPGTLDVGAFRIETTNQIVYVQNSQRTSTPVNFGETLTHGVEIALQMALFRWLDSQSNLTWTHAENRTDRTDVLGKQIPRIPRWEIYQGTSVHWLERIRLGHGFNYTSGNYWDATNFYFAAPRASHSAFLRYATRNLQWEASVLNLTNQTTMVMDRNPLSDLDDTAISRPMTDFIGYPLPGRTWLLSMKWTG